MCPFAKALSGLFPMHLPKANMLGCTTSHLSNNLLRSSSKSTNQSQSFFCLQLHHPSLPSRGWTTQYPVSGTRRIARICGFCSKISWRLPAAATCCKGSRALETLPRNRSDTDSAWKWNMGPKGRLPFR